MKNKSENENENENENIYVNIIIPSYLSCGVTRLLYLTAVTLKYKECC
jgi:hypothetical protein